MEKTQHAYSIRINRAIDYIHDHIEEELRLRDIARAAAFSPFHFHRIFGALVGESLNNFIRRCRLERAAKRMRAAPGRRLTDIAIECGFSSLSDFSRSFKQVFGVSPGRWDRTTPLKNRKIRQTEESDRRYTRPSLRDGNRTPAAAISVKQLAAQRIAYVRIVQAGNEEALASGHERLLRWMQRRRPSLPDGKFIGLFRDDADITPCGAFQYEIGFTIPPEVEGRGEVSVRSLPACTVASFRVKNDVWQVYDSWERLFKEWLPRNRYQPGELPAIEIYHNPPDFRSWKDLDIECCLPIDDL